MHKIILNQCLNQESKYYGLSYGGIIGSSSVGCLAWLKFGMTVGILLASVSYGVAAYLASKWHQGSLQRLIYWHLPFKKLFGGRYLPDSHKRCMQ